jgi:hypothetical protein
VTQAPAHPDRAGGPARRLGAAALVLLAPVAVLTVWLPVRTDLPGRLATHWGFGNRPNGFDDATAFLAVATAVVAVVAVVGAVVVLRAGGAVRPAAAVSGFLAWVLAGSTIAVVVANRGLADPHDARSGWPASVLAVGVAAALAGAIAALAPAPAQDAPAVPAPAYALRAGERVTWVGTASQRWFLVAAGVFALPGAVVLARRPVLGVGLLVLAAALAWSSSLTVRVDDAGVRAHFGPLPWPAVRVGLDRIEAAEVREIEPMRWGGWGYRFSRRGTALVVRRGPGLVLHRRGRSDLAITVDRAEEGAGLVNALVARRASAG